MNPLDFDANVVKFLRVLKKFGLISRATYSRLGTNLMVNGEGKKDKWRKANWKDFLKSG